MTRNASANNPLTPAPIAASFPADDDGAMWLYGEFDADGNTDADTDAVDVKVTVEGTSFVLLGDVEPDVRLKITRPASM